jgi:hypothetical protein
MGNLQHIDSLVTPAGVRRDERLEHLLVVGRGALTTPILTTFALEDILGGFGVVFIGSERSAENLLQYIPPTLIDQVIYFAPGNYTHRPVAWNLLRDVKPDERFKVAGAVTGAFGSIYRDFWGPQSDFLLRTAVQANLDLTSSTLLGCLPMLANTSYRTMVRKQIKDPLVLSWWNEYEKWPDKKKQDATAPLQNKLGALLTNLPVRNIVGQVKNKLDIGAALQGKIVVVALEPKHLGGQEMVRLIGSLLLFELIQAGYRAEPRVDPHCFIYIEQTHTLSPDVLQELTGAAHSPFSVALATTHMDRLDRSLERSLMGSCGAIMASRSSYADAERFHEHFGSLKMKEREFVDMAVGELAVKLPEGEPFWSELTLRPEEQFMRFGKTRSIINRSLDRYGSPRAKVERNIKSWARKWLTEK